MSALKRENPSAVSDLHGQLAGEYRILRKLGAGGFGTVYEAEHPLLKRRAAVKVLHNLPGLAGVAVQRFIEEARSASQIRHRNIVDIFSFGTLPNGQYFYVMDLLDGAPLDRYLKEHGRLLPEQGLPLLRAIAQALDALHSASIVHRDVKPANIYLAWDGSGAVVPKLLDFGLVKLLGTASVVNTVSGVPLGTPFYMSPEQCRGDQVDARADIYSLGVVCHEVLTGTRPFTGESATAVLVAHVMQPPPRMSESCADLSPDLDEPVLRMLAKDPAARPSSAVAALRDLERSAQLAGITIADGESWLPRPQSTPVEPEPYPGFDLDATVERSGLRDGTRPARRRAGWLAGVGVLVALAVVSATWLLRAPQPTAAVVAIESTALAPPPIPAIPQPTAATTTPEPPGPITLTLRAAPNTANVWLGDRTLGPAAQPLLLPFGDQPLHLRVVAPGYVTINLDVTPNASQELTLTPEKMGRAAPKRGSLPRDLENPF